MSDLEMMERRVRLLVEAQDRIEESRFLGTVEADQDDDEGPDNEPEREVVE